ncbi:DUF2333 family protein [Thiorhodococcus minor]|uniref:DUF2333 family protein n=1 Tax=Thiorhodococcus minor TaxID=57489 RepID=A0A6M0JUJ8_9GAMM|nr:DUF2333 family protein [Thiorhodococcus minor]NEV60829.1 DUF2333 family protein [Thiorhodococcus minor]
MTERRAAPNPPSFPPPEAPSSAATWLKRALVAIASIAGLYLLVVLALAYYWCHQPATFEIAEVLPEGAVQADGAPAPGSALVTAVVGIGETLLDKPGGFLHNDVVPPGAFLDNCPSWECGALMAVKDSVRSLRNDFSRSQSQSFEDDDVKRADLQFAIDPKSWLFPAAEDEYRQGIDALKRYREKLMASPQSGNLFHARADNLADYLNVIEKRLGHQGSRLSSSVADPVLTQALAPKQAEGEVGTEAPKTPWDEVDDVFYCTRGYSWALLHIMQAIQLDFRDTIEAKNAEALLSQIIRDLQGATRAMSSPIILNGDGYGVLANHSLTIASYVSRVNASVLDLKILLKDG